jgi:hypothetical protein
MHVHVLRTMYTITSQLPKASACTCTCTHTLQIYLTKVPPCAAYSRPILVGGLFCRVSTHSTVLGKPQVVVGAQIQAVGRCPRVPAQMHTTQGILIIIAFHFMKVQNGHKHRDRNLNIPKGLEISKTF